MSAGEYLHQRRTISSSATSPALARAAPCRSRRQPSSAGPPRTPWRTPPPSPRTACSILDTTVSSGAFSIPTGVNTATITLTSGGWVSAGEYLEHQRRNQHHHCAGDGCRRQQRDVPDGGSACRSPARTCSPMPPSPWRPIPPMAWRPSARQAWPSARIRFTRSSAIAASPGPIRITPAARPTKAWASTWCRPAPPSPPSPPAPRAATFTGRPSISTATVVSTEGVPTAGEVSFYDAPLSWGMARSRWSPRRSPPHRGPTPAAARRRSPRSTPMSPGSRC